jgi:tetratricopeptide (TPR) repeat protein
MKSGVLRTWSQLREAHGISDELFDLPSGDAPRVLLERVVWNTDFGRGNGGFIPQADAMARLVIRLEHWFEVCNGDAMALAAAWLKTIDLTHSIPQENRDRCTMTCADALLETGKYEAALRLWESLLQKADYEQALFSARAKINRALALHQLGRVEEALLALQAVDARGLEEGGTLILTVKAEWARYLAARSAIVAADQRDDGMKGRTAETARQLVVDIGRLLVGSEGGRTGYLRALFVGQLLRDIEAILAFGI